MNGVAATVSIPLTLTLTANQNQWIGLDINLNNAITTSNGTTISIDFTQANIFAATTTPAVNLPAGTVDTTEDFVGIVTALTSSSITVSSGMTGQSITAAIDSATEIDDVPTNYSSCISPTSCLALGSIVSLDSDMSAAGALTASEIDILDAAATDEVEGIIYPTTTAGVVEMIIADKYSASGNAVLSASTTSYGTEIFLTASTTANYVIDTKTLTFASGFTPIGFSGSGDLLAGQRVRVQVSGVTSSANNTITGTAKNIALRFSRFAATVGSITGSNFTITSYPNYIGVLNTSLGTSPFAFTYSPNTIFYGVTGTSNMTSGSAVSIRALYLDNAQSPFAVAKVRVP